MKQRLSGAQHGRRVEIRNTSDDAPAYIADRHLEKFDHEANPGFESVVYEGAYELEPAGRCEWVVPAGDELHVDGDVEIDEIPAEHRHDEHDDDGGS